MSPEAYGLGWPSIRQARDFFFQLEKASAALRARIAGSASLAPYGRPTYSGSPPGLPRASTSPDPANRAMGPGGVVLHFTAGPTLASAVRWFCDPAQNSGRAAHLVIGRDREAQWRSPGDWIPDCPMVLALPALPVQCRLPTQAAVAGSWSNAWALHIEMVGWGCGAPDREAIASGWPQVAGRRWQPFTAAQLATAAYIIRCVRAAYGTFTPNQVWGHEHVQTVATPASEGINKLDCGPLMPIVEMRNMVATPADVVDEAVDGDLVGLVLEALGYGCGRGIAAGLRMAQYSLGLEPDGQPGPKTQAALAARVQDRLGLAGPLAWGQVAQRLPALQAWRYAALASVA